MLFRSRLVPFDSAFANMAQLLFTNRECGRAVSTGDFDSLNKKFEEENARAMTATREDSKKLWTGFLSVVRQHLGDSRPYFESTQSFKSLGLGSTNESAESPYSGPCRWLLDVTPVDPWEKSDGCRWSYVVKTNADEIISLLTDADHPTPIDTSHEVNIDSRGNVDKNRWQITIEDPPGKIYSAYKKDKGVYLEFKFDRGWKKREQEYDLIANVIACAWVSKYSVGTEALENYATLEGNRDDLHRLMKSCALPLDGHIAWQYQWLQSIGSPIPFNTLDVERQALEKAKDRIRKSLSTILIDDIYGALIKLKSRTSATSTVRSRTPTIHPSWVIHKLVKTATKDNEIDLPEPTLVGETDMEDERLLRRDPAYRGKVFTWVLCSQAKTGRCFVCLRLTKNQRQCSFCLKNCCTRDCLKVEADGPSLCNPCYDKLVHDQQTMDAGEKDFEYRHEAEIRKLLDQKLERRIVEKRPRPASNEEVPTPADTLSFASDQPDEDEDVFSVDSCYDEALSDCSGISEQAPKTLATAEIDIEAIDAAIQAAYDKVNGEKEREDDDEGEFHEDPTEPMLVKPRMAREDLDDYLIKNSLAAGIYPFGINLRAFSGQDPDGSPQMAKETAKVEIAGTIHWDHSFILTRGYQKDWNKHVRDNPILGNCRGLEEVNEGTILQALASVRFPHGMIDSITEATGSEKPVDTTGRWFKLSFTHQVLDSFFSDPCLWKEKYTDWNFAWHGTALHNLPRIVNRGLVTGPNALPNKNGYYRAQVYCEREARKHLAFMYSTHVAIPNVNPCWWFGALCELLVDRNRGGKAHGQWRQEAGSVHLTGAWIHVCDIRKAYEPGYVSTMRVSQSQYEDGMSSLLKQNDEASNNVGNFTLRDALEYRLARRLNEKCPEPMQSKEEKHGSLPRDQAADQANARGPSAVQPQLDTTEAASSSKAIPAKARPGSQQPPWAREKDQSESDSAQEIFQKNVELRKAMFPSWNPITVVMPPPRPPQETEPSVAKTTSIRTESSRSIPKARSGGDGETYPWREKQSRSPRGSDDDEEKVNIFRKRP